MRSSKKEKVSEIASTEGQVGGDHGSFFSQSIKKSICYDSDSNSHHYAKKNKNQNSNSTESCEVISNPLLLEDLRFYIFTFVSLNCLLNSARYVCKSWAYTIGSSHFAEVSERCAHYKFGIFVENITTLENSYFLGFKDYVNGQFERINLGIPRRMGRIVRACDGMLLLRNISGQSFFVNPILKCWLKLPHFPISHKGIVFGYQVNVARVHGTAKFKLFFTDSVEVSGVYWYVLYVLRIGIDNSWKEIVRKESPLQQHFLCKTLYNRGNDLYWITNKVVFVIDVVKEIILRECPLPYLSNLMGQTYLLVGDRLSYVASNDLSTFQIYILNFDSGKLSLYHEMGPFDFVATCGREVCIVTIQFSLWIHNQIIFKVTLRPNKEETLSLEYMHFCYNVKTKQLAKIENIDVGDFAVWLHTNNLFSLPNTPI